MAKQNSQPLISVIIPCYNYGKYLPHAVESVLAQKGEDFDCEIIIVDDGSSDNTAEIAGGFGEPVQYVYQENQGLSAARNTGIRNTSGDFIIFLDADDLLGPNVIEAHLKNFRTNQEIDLSICHCYCVNKDTGENIFWPLRAAHHDLHLCHSNIAPVHAFMTRRETIRDVGFFDTGRTACEDYDFWLRCAKLGKRFAIATEAFVVYIQHGDSMSGQSNRQIAQDIAVRLEALNWIDDAAHFPRAGSYYGRLAFASGLISTAGSMLNAQPQYALELMNRSASALLEGARAFPKTPPADPHLIQAERYYALNYFLYSGNMGNNCPPLLRKAFAFIETRYPNLVKGSFDDIAAKLRYINRRLVGDFSLMPAMLKTFKLPEE